MSRLARVATSCLAGSLAGVALLGLAACGDDTGPPDARAIDAPPEGGTVSLSWSISDEGAPLTCTQIGSSIVSLAIVPDEQPFGMTDVLPCGPGMGTSRVVPPGLYDVTVTLGGVDVDGVRFDDVEVVSGGDTPIGDAAFEVNAEGGFTFRISAGGQGNCTTPAQGGAGITAMQLELATLAGDCVPVTFDIAAGASLPASTYTTDCTTPAPHACIAQDQQITVAPTVPSGTYRMAITGFVEAAACWARLAQFNVPAAGATATLPQQTLTLDDDDPACAPAP